MRMRSGSATDVPPNFCTTSATAGNAIRAVRVHTPDILPVVGTPKRERKKANRQLKLEEQRREAQRASMRKRIVLFSVIALVLLGGLYVYSLGGDDDTETSSELTDGATTDSTVAETTDTTAADDATTEPESTVECPPVDGTAEPVLAFDSAPPLCIDSAKSYTAEVVTSMGDFTIELDAAAAPQTVNNFVFLARNRYYEGVTFHRVITGFVIQGGDPVGDPPGSGGPGYAIDDELPDEGAYEIGSVAMANSGPNTNGSQFFVVTGDQGAALPAQYSLFGTVTDGLDTALAIQEVETDANDSPVEPVTITSITITES